MNYLYSFRYYLGKYWVRNLLILIVFIIWPCIVFSAHIDFDYAKFTTIWIQTTSASIVLAIILKMIVSIQERHSKIDRIVNNISIQLSKVKEIIELLNTHGNNNKITSSRTLLQIYKEDFDQLTVNFCNSVNLEIINSINFDKLFNSLAMVSKRNDYKDINPSEFDAVINTLNKYFDELLIIKKSITN